MLQAATEDCATMGNHAIGTRNEKDKDWQYPLVICISVQICMLKYVVFVWLMWMAYCDEAYKLSNF